MFGIPPKIFIAGIALIAVLATIYLGYRHYTGLLETVRVLGINNAQLETAVGIQQYTIDDQGEVLVEWRVSQDALVALVAELQRVAEDAERETRRLNDIFSRHDLTRLARARPGLIERRINAGAVASLRMLECASGAETPHCSGGDGAAAGTPTAAGP